MQYFPTIPMSVNQNRMDSLCQTPVFEVTIFVRKIRLMWLEIEWTVFSKSMHSVICNSHPSSSTRSVYKRCILSNDEFVRTALRIIQRFPCFNGNVSGWFYLHEILSCFLSCLIWLVCLLCCIPLVRSLTCIWYVACVCSIKSFHVFFSLFVVSSLMSLFSSRTYSFL